jgi:hypothetical protein
MILLIVCILVLGGCKTTDIDKNDSNNEKTDDVINNDDSEASEDPDPNQGNDDTKDNPEEVEDDVDVFSCFNALLVQENKAGVLGNYITDHFTETTATELESMIEWLVIYQTEDIDVMNKEIYNDEYLNSLNQDMNGILDPRKISFIKDDTIRAAFQNLFDGYMTIVRYEETPVVETDWAALEVLVPYVTEDFGTMIRLNSRIQNSAYGRREVDFGALAMDAITIETLIDYSEPVFLSWQLNQLYNRQISNLLIGPEGSYIDTFISKAGQLYETLIAVSNDNPDSKLGGLINTLDLLQTVSYTDISTLINTNNQFGVGSDNHLLVTKNMEEENSEMLIQISIPGNLEIESIINNSIMDVLDEMKSEMDSIEDYSVYMYSEYSNYKYISISIYLSYDDVNGNYMSSERYLNYDLSSGQLISLEDYLGLSYYAFKPDLTALTGISFLEMPQYSISYRGIDLYGDDNLYANLTLKDLTPYIELGRYYQ